MVNVNPNHGRELLAQLIARPGLTVDGASLAPIADLLALQDTLIGKLQAALEPIAQDAGMIDPRAPDDAAVTPTGAVRIGHLRAIAALHRTIKEAGLLNG